MRVEARQFGIINGLFTWRDAVGTGALLLMIAAVIATNSVSYTHLVGPSKVLMWPRWGTSRQ